MSVRHTAISPRSPGSVTARNSRNGPAPSTRAASYSDVGIFCTPAVNSTIASPKYSHVPTNPTDGSASEKSPNHDFPSMPNQPRIRFSAPLSGS